MTDDAILRKGHYEINPAKMKKVESSVIKKMSDEEIDKIVRMRTAYLEWIHHNFANKVIKPPERRKRE